MVPPFAPSRAAVLLSSSVFYTSSTPFLSWNPGSRKRGWNGNRQEVGASLPIHHLGWLPQLTSSWASPRLKHNSDFLHKWYLCHLFCELCALPSWQQRSDNWCGIHFVLLMQTQGHLLTFCPNRKCEQSNNSNKLVSQDPHYVRDAQDFFKYTWSSQN